MKSVCRVILCRIILLAAIFLPLAGCGQTPQLGGQRECLSAADALWTAVTAKRADLLDNSATEVERLHAAASLPDAAFDVLSGVIAKARAGEWTDARVTLKAFIRGQRPATG